MAHARTSEESERAISKVTQQMSGKLLEKTQGWLVLRENRLKRQDSWILSACGSVAAIIIMASGYEVRAW
jgi:hypothetical protein